MSPSGGVTVKYQTFRKESHSMASVVGEIECLHFVAIPLICGGPSLLMDIEQPEQPPQAMVQAVKPDDEVTRNIPKRW
jgi:hypothetical protein